MTDVTAGSMSQSRPTQVAGTSHVTKTGWTGWIVFGAIMMIIAGSMQVLYGIIALVNDEWVVWGNDGSLYLDISTWGWVHLLIGAGVILAGFGLLRSNVVARIIAVAIAVLSILANFMFMPAYPVWAITVIAVDVLVIWAVTAHGDEARAL